MRATDEEALGLFLFQTDPAAVRHAEAAGIDGFVVDWEVRGKERRQAGEGTQINRDTVDDLEAVRDAASARVICRLNGFGPWTRDEVDAAVDAGANEVLLPMVRSTEQVDATLDAAGGRCGVGILIETQTGVARAAELCRRPLSRVYVGLNDLRIDRGSRELFEPMIDGTVDFLRDAAGDLPFGVAGLTLPDRGDPVPSHLLAAELVRLDARFTFLRRSFLADTRGRQLEPAVASMREHERQLRARTPAQVLTDRCALVAAVAHSIVQPA